MNGAGNRSSGQTGPASRLIRQRKRTDYCQLHLSSPFYRGQGPRLAYPALDNPRRNRIIPMNEMALLLGQRRPAFWVICCLILLVAEGFASADATKGHKNKRSLRSPFGNLRRGHSHVAWFLLLQEVSLLRERQGAFRSPPLTPSARTLPCCFWNTVTVGS